MNQDSDKSAAARPEKSAPVAAIGPSQKLLFVALVLSAAAILFALWLYFFALSKAQAEIHSLQAKVQTGETELVQVQSTRRSNDQRVIDMSARQGVLRDELLAQAQRLALIESAVQEQEDIRQEGHRQLRLDEVELLLVIAKARLELAGDQSSALKAYRLAEQVLLGLNEPNLLNLHQSLQQEIEAIESLPADPRVQANQYLDELQVFIDHHSEPAKRQSTSSPEQSLFDKLLHRLVQVRDRQALELIAPQDRHHAQIAATLEIGLARTAMERRDLVALQQALNRLQQWLPRLIGDTDELKNAQTRITELETLNFEQSDPVVGGTLKLLKSVDRRRRSRS